MATLLIALGLLTFGIITAWKRVWGVYLIVFLLPMYQIRFAFAGIPMTFLEGMILALACFTIYDAFVNPARFFRITHFKKTFFWVFLFLIAGLISVFVSPAPIKAAGIFKAYFVEAVLFFFLIKFHITTVPKLNGLFWSLWALLCYLSIFGMYQFLTLANLPPSWWAVNVASRRITSLLNHPNALALLLGPILVMAIVFLQTGKTWIKNKILGATVIFGLIALYLSFSRASWLALIMTIALVTLLPSLLANQKFQNLLTLEAWKIRIPVISAIILILALVFILPVSRAKLLDLASGQDLAQKNRLVLWSAAFDILKKHPIAGVGLMGFRDAYQSYPLGPDQVTQNYPHNFFLNFWLETGLLGLVSMLGLLYLFFERCYYLLQTRWRAIGLATAAGMSMIILHSLVDVSYFKNDLSVLFWLIYALPNLNFLSE